MRNILCCILVSLSFVGVNAGTIDPSVPDIRYIEYGEKFNFVGKLCGEYKNNQKFCASAVVISENHILTAAHVVKGYKTCIITVDNIDYNIIDFDWPEEFSEDKFGLNDIAIGYCEKPIKLKFYPELYSLDDESGKVCSISGYGITGTFLSGGITSDSQRRAGSNVIDKIENHLLICTPSRRNNQCTSLEFLIASGDSGGGLFIDSKLAGINSCVSGETKSDLRSTYRSESGHTRISIHREWILNKIKRSR